MPVHKDGIKSTAQVSKVAKRKRKAKSTDRERLPVDVSDVRFPNVAKDLEAKMRSRLADAAEAFDADRFKDADQLLASIETLTPGVPEVSELRGLSNYRLGKWKVALNWLEEFEESTGSIEQHPVIADCYRALKQWGRVEDKWLDVAEASPGPEILEEIRIVQAGALSDQGKVAEAIAFLEKAPRGKGKANIYVLRRMYVLGDLYERSGSIQNARSIYSAILGVEPQFGDVAERLSDLS